MKLFDRAILKLTGIYAAILLVICVSFSTVIYDICIREMNKPLHSTNETIFISIDEDDVRFITARDEAVQKNLLSRLILVNIWVLSGGMIASYFLARWTLKPLSDAMEIQGRFVSDASHELRTPLAAMVVENDVTLRNGKAAKDELRAQIGSNLEEVYKLQKLTDRLLKLGQNEPIKLTEIDTALALDEALKRTSALAHSKKITVKNQLEPHKIRGNLDALSDILVILINNAIKFSPSGSTVTIGGNKQQIFVHDQGTGIAADDLPYIFDRFYRAEKSRTTSGHGLGLPLAKSIAEKMNMKITAQNNPEAGATFTISI